MGREWMDGWCFLSNKKAISISWFSWELSLDSLARYFKPFKIWPWIYIFSIIFQYYPNICSLCYSQDVPPTILQILICSILHIRVHISASPKYPTKNKFKKKYKYIYKDFYCKISLENTITPSGNDKEYLHVKASESSCKK